MELVGGYTTMNCTRRRKAWRLTMLPLTYHRHAAAKLRGCVLKAGLLPLTRRFFNGWTSGAAASGFKWLRA